MKIHQDPNTFNPINIRLDDIKEFRMFLKILHEFQTANKTEIISGFDIDTYDLSVDLNDTLCKFWENR